MARVPNYDAMNQLSISWMWATCQAHHYMHMYIMCFLETLVIYLHRHNFLLNVLHCLSLAVSLTLISRYIIIRYGIRTLNLWPAATHGLMKYNSGAYSHGNYLSLHQANWFAYGGRNTHQVVLHRCQLCRYTCKNVSYICIHIDCNDTNSIG